MCVDANTTETKVARSGHAIKFSCPFHEDVYDVKFKKGDSGNAIFTYVNGSQFTPQKGRFYFNVETLIVPLTNVSVEDEGVYTCTVTKGDLTTLITTTHVHVYSKLFLILEQTVY